MKSERERTIAGAAVRGVVAAMAMTGMRTMTRGLGLVQRPPPDEIAEEGVPQLLARIPAERRDAALEIAHWLYGGAAGALYGAVPSGLRQSRWSGPAYGLAIWLAFESVIAPALGIRHTLDREPRARLAVAGDHVLYGAVVASPR